MKMTSISLEIPKALDEHFREEARRRMISKSAVIRELLFNHVQEMRQGGGNSRVARLSRKGVEV